MSYNWRALDNKLKVSLSFDSGWSQKEEETFILNSTSKELKVLRYWVITTQSKLCCAKINLTVVCIKTIKGRRQRTLSSQKILEADYSLNIFLYLPPVLCSGCSLCFAYFLILQNQLMRNISIIQSTIQI